MQNWLVLQRNKPADSQVILIGAATVVVVDTVRRARRESERIRNEVHPLPGRQLLTACMGCFVGTGTVGSVVDWTVFHVIADFLEWNTISRQWTFEEVTRTGSMNAIEWFVGAVICKRRHVRTGESRRRGGIDAHSSTAVHHSDG